MLWTGKSARCITSACSPAATATPCVKIRRADYPLQKTPREFVRDPVLLEFPGLPETGRLLEAVLEQALINKLQGFLLELGKGFAFVARQMRISTETKDFYIDLVFYK